MGIIFSHFTEKINAMAALEVGTEHRKIELILFACGRLCQMIGKVCLEVRIKISSAVAESHARIAFSPFVVISAVSEMKIYSIQESMGSLVDLMEYAILAMCRLDNIKGLPFSLPKRFNASYKP